MEWATLTPKSLWTQIKLELKSYYDWDLQADSLESMVEQFSLQKISLLRYILHFFLVSYF
jgi:protein TIF31